MQFHRFTFWLLCGWKNGICTCGHGTVQQGSKCIKTCVCSFETAEPDIGNRWISTCAACPLQYPWTKRGDHHS
ncbi:hypothetical protein T11_4270 [Trichinella zimbabwensis]|uniref:Secreted protein n=1 Tax=Trichinella zimbabwensis TaxID=268475 RepID=A0A0V1H7H1_9BILA|nr:hypothetical protein T11_4270 [Trichinella zimbabwensis]